MEAFILEGSVLTAEHMSSQRFSKLKYMKKYDLPPRHTVAHSQVHQIYAEKKKCVAEQCTEQSSIRVNKKELLSSLENVELESLIKKEANYKLTRLNELFKPEPRSSKSPKEKKPFSASRTLLLLKKQAKPPRQYYDSNYDFVIKKNPVWTILPKHTVVVQNSPDQPHRHESLMLQIRQRMDREREEKKLRRKIHKLKNKERMFKDGKEKDQNKLYEELNSNKRRHKGAKKMEHKLHYSEAEFNRSTNDLLRKYRIDQSAYFKNLIHDMCKVTDFQS